MQYNRLGKTDLQVSQLCLGTMTFGEQNSEADGHRQLDYALDKGINFIDTAELYPIPRNRHTQGATERILGAWIRSRGQRERFVLASKIAGPSPGLSYIRDPLRFDEAQLRQALEGSLRRLQTDYLDLYQLHWPERTVNNFGKRHYPHRSGEDWADNLQAILECAQALIKEGKIHHFGISNETPWGAMRFLQLSETHGLPRCVSIQNPYNLLNRSFEIGLSEIALRETCGLLAYSPLAFGLLSGKYHTGRDTAADRLNRFRQMARYNGEGARQATAAYLELARQHGLSLAQMALAFVRIQPFVTSTIIGATTLEQLQENIDSIDIELTDEVLTQIATIQERFPDPAP